MLQLLALVGMEPPADDAELRARKLDVLRSARRRAETAAAPATRPGRSRTGARCAAYADEEGVDPARCTETFAEVVLELETPALDRHAVRVARGQGARRAAQARPAALSRGRRARDRHRRPEGRRAAPARCPRRAVAMRAPDGPNGSPPTPTSSSTSSAARAHSPSAATRRRRPGVSSPRSAPPGRRVRSRSRSTPPVPQGPRSGVSGRSQLRRRSHESRDRVHLRRRRGHARRPGGALQGCAPPPRALDARNADRDARRRAPTGGRLRGDDGRGEHRRRRPAPQRRWPDGHAACRHGCPAGRGTDRPRLCEHRGRGDPHVWPRHARRLAGGRRRSPLGGTGRVAGDADGRLRNPRRRPPRVRRR